MILQADCATIFSKPIVQLAVFHNESSKINCSIKGSLNYVWTGHKNMVTMIVNINESYFS